jgi:UDP-N-acetyl-D-mannosaminuronic acid transferase (WecB/TagA/CpsF family)
MPVVADIHDNVGVAPAENMRGDTERVLGLDLFAAPAAAAAECALTDGSFVIVAPSPALLKLRDDEKYREAMQRADFVLGDSALLARVWRAASGRRIERVSGVAYLNALLTRASAADASQWIWVLDSPEAAASARAFLAARGVVLDPAQLHVCRQERRRSRPAPEGRGAPAGAPRPRRARRDSGEAWTLSPRLPRVSAGYSLCRSRARFLTGAERRIPRWADEHAFGWLFRLASQPSMLLPRIGIAVALAGMVLRYRSAMPPLRPRWADV